MVRFFNLDSLPNSIVEGCGLEDLTCANTSRFQASQNRKRLYHIPAVLLRMSLCSVWRGKSEVTFPARPVRELQGSTEDVR